MLDLVQREMFMRTKARYPWDQWSDERWWLLEYGNDFTCSRQGMQSAARQYAQRNSMLLETRIVTDGLLVRFVRPSEGEL